MRRASVMCIMAVLLTAGPATANTVWNPTDPNVIAAGFSNWDIAENWTNGLPGVTDQKPVFNAAGAAVECQVTTNTLPFSDSLVVGEGGAAGILRIMDGGTITKTGGNWSCLGYNNDGGTMIVEEGGQAILDCHLWFGMNAGGIGRLVINGGYVKVKDALDLGRDAGGLGLGFVTINSGMLRIRYYPDYYDNVGSLCNIKFGTLVIENNYTAQTSQLWSRINAGTIVGFGGKSPLVVTREPFDGATRTFVRATSPMNPSPAYDSTVAVAEAPAPAPVNLNWTNMDPNAIGDDVYVDVWFGTDPTWVVDENDPNNSGYADFTKIVDGQIQDTVEVNAPVIGTSPTTYYWRVDSYIYGAPTGKPDEGDVFKFNVTDDLAPTVVIETPDTVTWPNQAVQLDATVSDTGTSALTIAWTASDSTVVFSPSASVEDPTVTVDHAAGNVTLTCTVWDALNPEHNSDTMVLNVAADACQAAVIAGANYPMDIVEPFCVVDIADLAAVAADWLTDYTLMVPTVIP